jgi:O-antigen/teichoic acid export membrane protein
MLRILRSNRILSAYSTSLLGVFSGLLTNLWLLRTITFLVPVKDFGTLAFVGQITGYLAILNLSLDFAASRQIAESLGKDDFHGANIAYREHERVNNYTALACALIVVLLAFAVSSLGLGHQTGASRTLAVQILLISGGAQVCSFLQRRYSAALIGSKRQSTANVITVCRTVSSTLIAYVCLRRGFGIVAVPIGECVTQGLSLLLLHVKTAAWCNWIAPTKPTRHPEFLKGIVRFGSLATIGGFGWTVESSSDVVILGFFGGATTVGLYALWWRFPQMLFDLCTRLTTSAFPEFARSHGISLLSCANLLQRISYIVYGLATLAMLGISVWLPRFMRLWASPQYWAADGQMLARLMGLLVLLRVIGNLHGMFLMATGQAKVPAVLSWAQAAIKIALAIPLAARWGVAGCVGASVIASTIQVVGLGILVYRGGYLSHRAFRDGAALTLLAIGASLVSGFIASNIILPVFVAGAVSTALFWAVLWCTFAWRTELRQDLGRVLGIQHS